MSTRCNVIVKNGKDKSYIYRHHDGYFSQTGVNLQEFVQSIKEDMTVEDVVNNLLLNKNHQLTDGVHGDIEYLYTISLQDKILKVYNTRDSDWNEVRRLIKTINFKGEELDEENC